MENKASQPDPIRPTPVVEPGSGKIPEAPNIPQEGATSSEGASSDVGRDRDGRSRRLKNQPRPCYYCMLGEKQIRSGVKRSNQKKEVLPKNDISPQERRCNVACSEFGTVNKAFR